jgi:hypothetical protein
MAVVMQFRRRQFLDRMVTGWRRIALLFPLRLEESRLSLGHATDSTTPSTDNETRKLPSYGFNNHTWAPPAVLVGENICVELRAGAV